MCVRVSWGGGGGGEGWGLAYEKKSVHCSNNFCTRKIGSSIAVAKSAFHRKSYQLFVVVKVQRSRGFDTTAF